MVRALATPGHRHSMPGRGLEPLRISPPDPKSGASANFATLAQVVSSHGTAAFVLGFVLERKPHSDQALPTYTLASPEFITQ